MGLNLGRGGLNPLHLAQLRLECPQSFSRHSAIAEGDQASFHSSEIPLFHRVGGLCVRHAQGDWEGGRVTPTGSRYAPAGAGHARQFAPRAFVARSCSDAHQRLRSIRSPRWRGACGRGSTHPQWPRRCSPCREDSSKNRVLLVAFLEGHARMIHKRGVNCERLCASV